MLTFSLGREQFAIASRYVFAVFPLTDLVPLPGASVPVVGLTRWRGDVLTILDVRRLVGRSSRALDDLGRVIVVGDSAPEFGVLADIVTDIVRIDQAALHPIAEEQRGDINILRGVTRDAMHVIDAETLMARQADLHASIDVPTSSSSPTTRIP